MENRLQHIFLKPFAIVAFGVAALFVGAESTNAGELKVNSELFDIGFTAGVINLEDFPAEFLVGASVTFKASESLFLQYNYVQADISKSSLERDQGNQGNEGFDIGSDRSFTHYDLLVGYNLFQGEFFAGGGAAHLSSLYVVGGIGNTAFGSEENFSYTLGVGYQIEFNRKYVMRLDYRDYIYESALITGDDEDTVHNTQLSVGLGYLF